jgi:hypothetical protein
MTMSAFAFAARKQTVASPPKLAMSTYPQHVGFEDVVLTGWMTAMGANQTRRFARHSTLHPSHPSKALCLSSESRANRLCKFRQEKEIEQPASE